MDQYAVLGPDWPIEYLPTTVRWGGRFVLLATLLTGRPAARRTGKRTDPLSCRLQCPGGPPTGPPHGTPTGSACV